MADNTELENSSAEALLYMKEGKGMKSPVRGKTVSDASAERVTSAQTKKRSVRLAFTSEEDGLTSSPKRQSRSRKSAPSRSPSTPDKRSLHRIGLRVRNLLKLPKAYKWVYYEWFYSNLDRPLLAGENDFCVCLREAFPLLRTKRLTRVQWNKIRRLMGKPRRCSEAFFREERAALSERRALLREVQQRKLADVNVLKDRLPDEIPMPLVVGTKVTARLRRPHDGLFTGCVEAVDPLDSSYRVVFDRAGLGTHSVPDVEIMSCEPPEYLPLSAFAPRPRPASAFLTPQKALPSSPQLTNDPILGATPLSAASAAGGMVGGYPTRFLVLVTRLSKILGVKRDCVRQLREMNSQAERMHSYEQSIPLEFQRRYALLVLELEKLNVDLTEYLNGVKEYCSKVAPEQPLPGLEWDTALVRRSYEDARRIVDRMNTYSSGAKMVTSERIRELITRLGALMLQVKAYAESRPMEARAVHDTLEAIRESLEPANKECFADHVELHLQHIVAGMGPAPGNLAAFRASIE